MGGVMKLHLSNRVFNSMPEGISLYADYGVMQRLFAPQSKKPYESQAARIAMEGYFSQLERFRLDNLPAPIGGEEWDNRKRIKA